MIMGNGYMPRILPILEGIQNFAYDGVSMSSIYPLFSFFFFEKLLSILFVDFRNIDFLCKIHALALIKR